MTDRVRVLTHIPPETDKKVEAFMKMAGMTKSRVCSLAIISGIDALTMAFDPRWKEYFEAVLRVENDTNK